MPEATISPEQSGRNPFAGIARKALDQHRTSELPKELFHYTTATGLLGIIGQNSLWFTDSMFLNDSSEVLWGVQVVTDVANTLSKSLEPPSASLVQDVISRLRQISIPNRAAVFCLCEERNLLNQWRDYGRDVVSYSLGFDPAKLHLAPD